MNEVKVETKILSEETSKGKRKLLTDPNKLWVKCSVCKELGNLENMVYQKIGLKDQEGKELYGCFEGVYFCSATCQRMFNS